MKYEVIIIGAGASGLAAAVSAAKNKKLALVEGSKKLGKKLLATGNGRCNITNENLSLDKYHGDVKELAPYFKEMPLSTVISFFNNIGIITKADEEGRVYPINYQAQAVCDALERAAVNNNCDIYTEFTAVSVTKHKGVFSVKSADGKSLTAEKVIIASGGAAAPKLSCKNDSYSIIKSLNHSVTKLTPSLVQFTSKDKFLFNLQGVRAKANSALYIGDRKIREEKGEVQFNDKALSGICVMQLSSDISTYLNSDLSFKEKAFLELDLMPDYNFADLLLILKNIIKSVEKLQINDLLSGILNLKLGKEILKSLKLDLSASAKSLKEQDLKRVVSNIKAFRINLWGVKGFDDAQVTSGGVPLSEINLSTMESKRVKGLYFTGEVLNIHGDCGGYNLHFAFSTGIKAGKNI